MDTLMASSLKSALNFYILDASAVHRARVIGFLKWIGVRATGCFEKNEKTPALDGMLRKCLISIGVIVLLLQSAVAAEDEGHYEGSASTFLSQVPSASANFSQAPARPTEGKEGSLPRVRTDPPDEAESPQEPGRFSPALTPMVGAVHISQALVQSVGLGSSIIPVSEDGNQTIQWPWEESEEARQPSSSAPSVSSIFSPGSDINNMSLVAKETKVFSPFTTREADASPTKNATTAAPTENVTAAVGTATPSTLAQTPTAAFSTQETVTLEPSTTTDATTVTTTEDTTTTAATTTTTTTTTATIRSTSPPQMTVSETMTTEKTTTTTPRIATVFSTSTESTAISGTTVSMYNPPITEIPLQCNVTQKSWIKTVLSIHPRRNRLEKALTQDLAKALTQALRKSFNLTSVDAQVVEVTGVSNVTVVYYVASGATVFIPSVVVEAVTAYGTDRLMADIRQFVPLVLSIPLAVAPWRPSPDISLQVKTVLRFVGPEDNTRSCTFVQSMELRLENVFAEAESKVLNTYSRLSVQILSTSQSKGSSAVSLVYVVHNGTTGLNGAVSSRLLNQLTAEIVGYFLFFPPLIIAEPLEYHNLNTSAATRHYWVITVIQFVDNASLEGNYQSFSRLLEQRLAEVFIIAHQQGARFRRATTMGGYTVQMVNIRRVPGPKNPAEMTYYVQLNGRSLPGTSAAKILSTVDSQTMALTLGYLVQLQAEPVVKNPPSNLWIIAAVLVPIALVMVIVIIITAVLCRRNKSFKTDAIGNLNPRTKASYRREASFYHQPVQGFDYAKQHLGQQGGDGEALPVTQETMVLPLAVRDASLSQERAVHQDGTGSKKTLPTEVHKSRQPSEEGSVTSNQSGKHTAGRGSSVPRAPAQQRTAKEESSTRSDPYDSSSGSQRLGVPLGCSHPAPSEVSQDSSVLNGEVSLALKQRSDIEHYRNKLRLKAKRRGYYDFPAIDTAHWQRHGHAQGDAHGRGDAQLQPAKASTYVKSSRHSQVRNPAYRSRQSLNSPSPGGTEIDLLVMRERPGKGIGNSGYDTEPEFVQDTDVDHLMGLRCYDGGPGVRGHSESSTLSSQPSIDEVRQQMHLLLDEAFSLASNGRTSSGRRHHHGTYSPGRHTPYADVVTSAPGTMSRTSRLCDSLHWVPAYGLDVYPCSLPKPAFRFTQLPDIAMGSSAPPVPPRPGLPAGTSLRRSSSDIGPKGRIAEVLVPETQSQYDGVSYVPITRSPLPGVTADPPSSNSGKPITAVYAIPASRHFAPTPPASYRSPSWMSYPPEPEDTPRQWVNSVPLPGFVEAVPHPRTPRRSSPGLPRWKDQASHSVQDLHHLPSLSFAPAFPQKPADTGQTPNTSLSGLSTSALIMVIRKEVARLAKQQTDMFQF